MFLDIEECHIARRSVSKSLKSAATTQKPLMILAPLACFLRVFVFSQYVWGLCSNFHINMQLKFYQTNCRWSIQASSNTGMERCPACHCSSDQHCLLLIKILLSFFLPLFHTGLLTAAHGASFSLKANNKAKIKLTHSRLKQYTVSQKDIYDKYPRKKAKIF